MIKNIQKGTFEVVMSAVNKLADFVAPTYGPQGNKVIISKPIYRMVVDDGVQVARDFELEGEEEAVIKVIKEAAIKTNDRVGDGTTSSLLILRGIMEEVSKQTKIDGRKISAELKKACQEAKTQLLKKAKKVSSKEDLERVARVSFDDPKIATIIADLLFKVGVDGSVTLDSSNTMETTSEYVQGITIRSGYVSPYMITDPHRMDATLDNAAILITSYRLTNANDILPVMNLLVESGKRELLIIAEGIEKDALATLIANRMQGKFAGVAIQMEGLNRREMMEDIALLTGATLFTEEKGNQVDKATLQDLGQAKQVIVKAEKTVIVGGRGSKTEIEKERTRLKKTLMFDNPSADLKKNLEKKLATLSNSVAVLKVGGATDAETKALKYKVEDSVNATRSALQGGIVCGGGIALKELKTSSPILNKALKQPYTQLLENMGIDELTLGKDEAYNFVSEEQGQYFKVGVIDPVEVLIAGIESAVSIASILCAVKGIIVECPDKEK